MRNNPIKAPRDEEAIRGYAAKRGAEYRLLSFKTITLDAWREIVEVAYEEALLGDDRARVWIQRTIGFADAARIERAVRAVAAHVVFTDLLDAVEEARRAAANAPLSAAEDALERERERSGKPAPYSDY
ncbi:MAG TPA: hypothetical protein VMV69_29570 [Pirellulales bacterium]|nr:hypothetical protein [Pirellulales bacterium]